MTWFPYALTAVVAFALWGLLGRLALDHATWSQVSLLFGVVTVLLFASAGVVRGGSGWTTRGLALGALTGLAGAVGIGLFYLALERGPASQVVPVIGVYPVLTAVLAVVFLSDRLTALQTAGAVMAVAGVLVVGLAA
ncbi:MAG: EamA family transporter [Frankiales bacterium]|jgi:uncharacterized membrane protein|nr:EamA family transporter [Frankiales bacterium]